MDRRALAVVLGCLVCQLGLGYGYVFGPLAPDILAEFGWTRTVWSAARAPQLFVVAGAGPLVGWLAFRGGGQRVLVAGTLILAVAFAGFSQMQALWQLSALTVVFGMSVAALGDIAVGQVVSRWVSRNRGLALGIVFTGSNLGGAIVTRGGSAIADASDWRDALLALSVAAVVVLLPFAIWVVRDTPAGRPVALDERAAADRAESGPGGSDRDLPLSQALRTRSFWILAASLFAFFFYFLGMIEHLVLHLTDLGMPRSEAAGHLSNAIALGMVSKVALGWIADRIAYKAALLLDFGLLAISSVILLFVPTSPFLGVFVVTYGFAAAARDVVYPLIISDCFGLRYMAPIYGVLMIALMPGGVLGPIFAAAVHDQLGSYQAAFATFAALNVAAVVSLLFLRDERRPVA